MHTISKDFTFCAAHRLNGLPREHQCSRLHGHNYVVRVTIQDTTLDGTGFVIDYGQLKPVGRFIDEHLDHQFLNDILPELGGPDQPSAELMAQWLAGRVRDLVPGLRSSSRVTVGLSETVNTWAFFDGDAS